VCAPVSFHAGPVWIW
jgi:hypothetical protein